MSRQTFFVLAIILLFPAWSSADVVYLKNGRSLEGVIVSEDSQSINLEVGFGTAKFERNQIDRIYCGSPQEIAVMKEKWQKNKAEIDKKIKEAALESESRPKQIDLLQQAGHVFVSVRINNKSDAALILDTGATLVVLSSTLAKKLGLSQRAPGKASVQMVLADGRRVNAQYAVLDSLKAQGVEARNVEAAILPEGIDDPMLKDGLLGMSFLKNFSFKVDYKKNTLTLEKLR